LEEAYKDIIALRIEEGRSSLIQVRQESPENPFRLLIENYADVLTLIISEDKKNYAEVKGNKDKRLKELSKLKAADSPWDNLLEAEIRFQWAVVKLKFNEEVSAAWELKKVYDLISINQKKYPDFIPNYKLLGLFEIFIGSVPENYQWLPKVFGYSGSVAAGMKNLRKVENSQSFFALEAAIYRLLAEKFVLNSDHCASCELKQLLKKNKPNLLLSFLTAQLLEKEGKGDEALSLLKESFPAGYYPLNLTDLLIGEVYLYKGEYQLSKEYLLKFLNSYKGQNHIKDAYYKLFLACWLNGENEKAKVYFEKVKSTGQAVYDADKYAQSFMMQEELPDPILMKARLSCDGGYYAEALKELSRYCQKKEPDHRDNIEFWYRKGRVLQFLGKLNEAGENFKKAISLSEGKTLYFAPNSCLQLGYIYIRDKNYQNAEYYFSKALEYQDYEYKNGIDNKAKAALQKLKKHEVTR
jgi:tetratricopeptide (TPR) repeat protein